MIDLRIGRWETVLADVGEVDAVISDPPYSDRTHEGHDDGASLANRAGGGMGAVQRDKGCFSSAPRHLLHELGRDRDQRLRRGMGAALPRLVRRAV